MNIRAMLMASAALLLAACSGDGSDCASAEEERATAFQQWTATVEDARACETNDDCVSYGGQPQCFQGCGYAVNAAEVAQLQSLASALQGRIDQCNAGPCPVPTCAPRPSGVACIEQRCTFADTR